MSSPLIRGKPDPSLAVAGSGCGGCATAGHTPLDGAALLAVVAGILALALRRRGARASHPLAAAVGLGSICVVAATTQGCGCGGGDSTDNGTGCGADCHTACQPGLPLGLIGAYTSVAKAPDGSIWVAGYNDAAVDVSTGAAFLYGDLVVGRYDLGKQQVQWMSVDGLPAPRDPSQGCPDYDPTGWRQGNSDTGNDVGLWTSIQLDGTGHPMVSYYDATNQALKFASYDGTTWSTHAILASPGSDSGRYSKMVISNGNPVVAFLTIEKGTGGHTRSKVSIAHTTVAVPHSPSDWSIEDALVDETGPCRPDTCDSGQACVLSTGLCAATVKGCNSSSCTGGGKACITQAGAPTCVNVAQVDDIHTYPLAVADYISFSATPQGLGAVVYDRNHGNLLGLSNASGKWQVAILDGETGSRSDGTAVDTGDDGVGASLFVASNGDWHVSYVNGITETLKYLYVPGGKISGALTAQDVDNGLGVDGASFKDGIHIVGDDSFVRADDSGGVLITYQDATAGVLRTAAGTSSGGKWELKSIPQPNRFAGFFPNLIPGDVTIANYWRMTDQSTKNMSGNVSIVTP